MLVAALTVGTVEGSILVNAADTATFESNTSINAAADFEFDAAKATITKYTGNNDKVEIPSSINGVPVKAIGDVAFASKGGITEVIIPEGVTTIGAEAFLNCGNLKKVTMGNSVTTIGELAFFMCENLSQIKLSEGLTSIEENTFFGCSSLKKVEVPSSVRKIVSHAFYDCTSLQEIKIPSNVTEFDTGIFTGVKSVKILCEKNSAAHRYAQANDFAYALYEVVQPTTKPDEKPTNTPTPKPTTAPDTGIYTVSYVLNGGKLSGAKVDKYDGSISLRLPKAVRAGYAFEGWYTEASCKNKIAVISKGSKGNKTLFAKFTKVKKPAKPAISYVKNKKSKQMSVKLKKKVSGVAGYEMKYATNKKFTKGKKTVRFTGTSKTVKSLKKGKTYYVKVRAYKVDSANKKVYGSYSSVKKVTIKK